MIRQGERDDPLDPLSPESFAWLWPQLFLSLLLLTFLFTTSNSGITQRERERERCVYGRVKLVEPGGFRPKIDSLQASRLVIIDQEGRVTNKSLIIHGDRWPTTDNQNGKALLAAPFSCGQKSRGSLELSWTRLMSLSCVLESSCLLRRWQRNKGASQRPWLLLQRHGSIFHVFFI